MDVVGILPSPDHKLYYVTRARNNDNLNNAAGRKEYIGRSFSSLSFYDIFLFSFLRAENSIAPI